MTHIVWVYETDDGIEVGRPYPMHPLSCRQDADLIGKGLLFESSYSPGNRHAIFSLPDGECLSRDTEEEFEVKAYDVLVRDHGEDMYQQEAM